MKPGQLPCIADFRLVLGENGVAFATDLQSVVAFNIASMAPLWSYSSAGGMDLVAATAGGGVTINDAQQGLVPLDANGSPGTPTGTAVLPVTPWGLGHWMGDPTGALAEFAGPSTNLAPTDWPMSEGSLQNQHSSPKLAITTFMPIAPAAGTTNARFNTALAAAADLQTNISKKVASDKIYTDSTDVSPLATIANFTLESGRPVDVLGFIGHGVYVTSTPSFAIGMQFTDNQLVRTPHPEIPLLNYEIPFPESTETREILLTNAKIIFVAACDTGDVFTTWWNLNFNAPPQGRALIVPDFPAMAKLTANSGTLVVDSQGVDLFQGAVAWEKLINSLHAGETAQQAVDDALPQVVFRLIGNQNVCPQNCKQ
jgi:hypothetical protein